jgi:hypothetical protein
VVDYACGSAYAHVLFRRIHWNGSQASFDTGYYNMSTFEYSPAPTDSVTTAWYAVPDNGPAAFSVGNCSRPHGAEGGVALPYDATRVNCRAASTVINPIAHLPGSCLTSESGCSLSGFICRLDELLRSCPATRSTARRAERRSSSRFPANRHAASPHRFGRCDVPAR